MIGLGLSITQLAVRQLVGQFNPMKLFALGEQGAWYDPSDLTTLFQDSAGTTPVTAVEQPVGLMLDKSKGLVLGPELVVNGGFDSDTGWTKGTNVTISDGVALGASLPATSLFVARPSTVALVAGKAYSISVEIKTWTAGSLVLIIGGTQASIFPGAVGTYKTIVTTSAVTQNLQVNSGGSGFTGTIDNISVRELPGAHASQTTATSRPVLSARVNLLTKTEQFDDAVWTKGNATVTPNAAVAPDGTMTADKLIPTAANSLHAASQSVATQAAANLTATAYLKAGELAFARLQIIGSAVFPAVWFDLSAGTISGTVSATGSIVSLGNGWYKASITAVTDANNSTVRVYAQSSGAFEQSFTGDGTSGIYLWGASLVPADQADLPYQRVNTATDYDAGPAFPRYLRCDGIDDGMVTGTITPGTDKAQVFAGVRKLSDGNYPVIAEFSSSWSANNGTFTFGQNLNNGYVFGSRGTSSSTTTVGGFLAPITNVLTGLGDISGDRATIRINGTQVVQNTIDQGTGNYLAYPLYLFRRGGTTLPFNGHFYGGIIRFGPNLPIETIEQTEAYMAAKTGVTLA